MNYNITMFPSEFSIPQQFAFRDSSRADFASAQVTSHEETKFAGCDFDSTLKLNQMESRRILFVACKSANNHLKLNIQFFVAYFYVKYLDVKFFPSDIKRCNVDT